MAVVDVMYDTLAATPEEVAAAARMLDSAELARAERFRFARDRRRFVMRRARVRQALAQVCGSDPRDIAYMTNAYGKPELAEGRIRFSASHSGEIWLVALSGSELGADCEEIKPSIEWRELSRSLFGPGEVSALEAQNPSHVTRAFFECWARKEAFVKAIGMGLSYPLDAFEVSVTPQPELLSGGAGWRIASVPIAPSHAAALVIKDDGYDAEIRLHRRWDCKSFATERPCKRAA